MQELQGLGVQAGRKGALIEQLQQFVTPGIPDQCLSRRCRQLGTGRLQHAYFVISGR